MHLHEELVNTDFERRVIFCEWVRGDLYKIVLFSDETTFHNVESEKREYLFIQHGNIGCFI